MPPDPDEKITEHECRAIRELYRGDYVVSELAFIFETSDGTVTRHANGECHHNGADKYAERVETMGYTEIELIRAYREVYDTQPYRKMSQQTYEEYRTEEYPAAATISKRFDGWPNAREKAHCKNE